MSKLTLTLCSYMKYFYLTVLFLTITVTNAVAKSPTLAAKSMSSLTDVREEGATYGKLVGESAHSFYSDMGIKKKSDKVKIEVLAAKAEFEDIDDVIATIENDKLPAPKRKKSSIPEKKVSSKIVFGKETASVEQTEKSILSFLDEKKDTLEVKEEDFSSIEVFEKASIHPKPMLNPKRETVVASKENPTVKDIQEVDVIALLKGEPKKKETGLKTYIAATVSDEEKKEIAEIIAEDVAWEEDWKKISSLNSVRDDKAFDKLLDDSFSFLPGQVPSKDVEVGSKASKMVTADDIEKLFGLDEKKKTKLPDFKISDYGDDGRWLWPVDQSAYQRISSKFGYRVHPVTKRRSFHKGVDIAAKRGTKVLASRSGKVELVTRHRNLGKYVKIRHKDGSYALYGHLSKRIAKQGRYVKAGQVIGKVGSTGRSTGPHLDFSIRVKEKAVDPLKRLSVPRKLARR